MLHVSRRRWRWCPFFPGHPGGIVKPRSAPLIPRAEKRDLLTRAEKRDLLTRVEKRDPGVNSMHGPCPRLNAPNKPMLFKLYNHASLYAQRLVSRLWHIVRFIVRPLFGAICSNGAGCQAFGVFLEYARVLNYRRLRDYPAQCNWQKAGGIVLQKNTEHTNNR